jgi:predicted Zn-dependent peptidase
LEQEWSIWNPKAKKPITLSFQANQDIDQLPKISYRQRGVAQTFLSVNFLLDEGYKPNTDQEKSEEIDDKEEMEKRTSSMANLLVLNAVLGQGFSSRLWAKGVEEEMLFGNIESKLNCFTFTSFLQISGYTDNLQFSFALECILSTLDSLRKTTVSINELSKTKSYLKGRLIREHENLLTNTIWNVENYLGSGLVYDLDKILEKIEKTEAHTLRSISLDLFIPERMSITTLGTAKETKLIDKLINKYLGQ